MKITFSKTMQHIGQAAYLSLNYFDLEESKSRSQKSIKQLLKKYGGYDT